MARFDRYLLQQLMLVFGFFSFVLVMIYWINRAVRLFDQLIADGQSASVFLEFSALSLPAIIVIALPLAAFVASVYTTNRLGQDSELVVMQATGFSAYRMARPVAYFGIIVFAILTILIHVLAPIAYDRLSARTTEVSQNMAARLLTPGKFIEPLDGITVYLRDIGPDGQLQDVFVSDNRDPETKSTYTASSAYLLRTEGDAQLVMVNGMVQTLVTDDNRLFVTSFEDFALNFSGAFSDTPDTKRTYHTFGSTALYNASPDVQAMTGYSQPELNAIVHGRIAETLLGFIAAMLGFSALMVGGFSRFGVWRQIILAIGLIVLIKAAETVGVNITRNDPAQWPAAYLHIALGLLLIAMLLFIAGRPYLFKKKPRMQVQP